MDDPCQDPDKAATAPGTLKRLLVDGILPQLAGPFCDRLRRWRSHVACPRPAWSRRLVELPQHACDESFERPSATPLRRPAHPLDLVAAFPFRLMEKTLAQLVEPRPDLGNDQGAQPVAAIDGHGFESRDQRSHAGGQGSGAVHPAYIATIRSTGLRRSSHGPQPCEPQQPPVAPAQHALRRPEGMRGEICRGGTDAHDCIHDMSRDESKGIISFIETVYKSPELYAAGPDDQIRSRPAGKDVRPGPVRGPVHRCRHGPWGRR